MKFGHDIASEFFAVVGESSQSNQPIRLMVYDGLKTPLASASWSWLCFSKLIAYHVSYQGGPPTPSIAPWSLMGECSSSCHRCCWTPGVFVGFEGVKCSPTIECVADNTVAHLLRSVLRTFFPARVTQTFVVHASTFAFHVHRHTRSSC